VLIALVAGAYRPGRDGVSAYTERLAASVGALGHDVVILGGAGAPGERDPPGVLRVTRPWDARGVRALTRAVRGLGADVVHIQFSPTAYGWRRAIGLLPALLRGRPPVVTTLHEHGSSASRPAGLRESLARAAWARAPLDRETLLLLRASAALVTTNPVDTARLARLAPTQIAIPPGVAAVPADRAEARSRLRERLGAPAEAEVVAFFGFLHPIKGIGHLFAAAERLRRARPALRVVLVGGFDSLALPAGRASTWPGELRALAAGHGLADAVLFTGHVGPQEASRLLHGADVAVLPSDFGTTTKSSSLMTALDHALPVVATRAEPPDPLLVDGQELLVVPPKAPDALAAALERILADPALAARLVAGGRAIVPSWEAVSAAHLAVYAAAVGQNAEGPHEAGPPAVARAGGPAARVARR